MPLSPLEQRVLDLLHGAWIGVAYRLRVKKLSEALSQPIDDVRIALEGLAVAGELALCRGDRGRHVRLLRPPAEPPAVRLYAGNFQPIPESARWFIALSS
jgi:hypothetical protein